MPKVSKRAEMKRAAKVARAHETELPRPERGELLHRAPGQKPPARGLARYPWAVALVSALILFGIGWSYYYHLGPFAPPTKVNKPVAASPCNASAIVKQLTNTSPAPTEAEFAKTQHTYDKAPTMSINTKKLYCVGLNTNRGLIVLELDPQIAPNTVNNFVFLAQHQYYDGMKFHRVVPGFVIQTGDPLGNGTGGPGYKFNDEPVKGNYTQGCIAMANSGANTNGSQFFICTGNDTATLGKQYNLFGHVTLGMDIAQKIQGPEGASDPNYATTKNITPDILNHVTVVAVNP